MKAIVETVAVSSRIHRKDLAEKLLAEFAGEELEARKLALASDLHWLIREGYVIEFNDGSLDLPRVKATNPNSSPASDKTPDTSPAEAVQEAPSTNLQTPEESQTSITKPAIPPPEA